MSFREKARELVSNQTRDVPPAPAPEPLRAGWAEPRVDEPIAQIEFQRALAHSALYRQPTAEELREATEQANLLAAAWARQR
jgi:hypothetical protein